MENIIEICVAIDIAILGIAYPIIVDKISNIGDKYSSQYISVLFNYDFPQKNISIKFFKKLFEISILKMTLYLTIFTFVFLIFSIKPLFGWDNYFINNSANLLVFIFSGFLTIFFFIWLDKAALYNGKSTTLLKYVIDKYNSLPDETEKKSYCLKSINELTFYAIEKQDEHLQKTLLEFYYKVFSNCREKYDNSKPFEYPYDLYLLVHKLNSELTNNNNRKLPAIEHRAISGNWLLGEYSQNIPISETTYNWMWRNLYTICDNPKFIKMYWANVCQYFNYSLRRIPENYNYETQITTNKLEISNREEERKEFLEFHYALGGLLLYRNQYSSIKYMFEYSQSIPPQYVLLPYSMTEIFYWFENFRNEFSNRKYPIDSKYYFPELDNLGNNHQIKYWICKYISILYIRQYTLQVHYVFQNHTSLPELPDDIILLTNWLDTVKFFEISLNAILENKLLMQELNFKKVVSANAEKFKIYVSDLRSSITDKIDYTRLNAKISEEKIDAFEINTNSIISKAFAEYESINNKVDKTIQKDDYKLYVNGGTTLLTKSAFTENDITHLNFDTVFAQQISETKIMREIPNSFLHTATKRYLLNKDNIVQGIEKLINNNKDVCIVGINVGYELKEILSNSKIKKILRLINSREGFIQDNIFVLKEKDLPIIEYKDLKEEEIIKNKLTLINPVIKLYTSIIDINTEENKDIKDNWNLTSEAEFSDFKVQLTISFLTIIHWKKDRDIIKINFNSSYREQGIQSNLTELEPLENREKGMASS